MKAFLYIAGFVGAIFIGALISLNQDVQQPPGVLAPSDPEQVDIVERSWTRGEVRYTAMAAFGVYARVLSVNQYWYDGQADISPVDLALGWGRMSDSDVIGHLSINQGGRFYTWRSRFRETLPIPKNEIISHSANMHMIPADENIKKTLLEVRTGELVRLAGYLVRVEKPRSWTWKSSLTRTDTGAGACEVVWVDWITRAGTVLQTASR